MRRPAGVCGFLALVLVAGDAEAELNQSIDLLQSTPFMPPLSMKDFRWGSFPIGPEHLKVLVTDTGSTVVMFRCGCLITSLAAATQALVDRDGAWFDHELWAFDSTSGFHLELDRSLSPKYLDDWLNVGPKPNKPRPSGWGYESGGGGSCGVRVWPWALGRVGQGNLVNETTGFNWAQRSDWSEATRTKVDNALLSGIPSLVGYRLPEPNPSDGAHMNVIVGWDNGLKKYLVWDVAWSSKWSSPATWAKVAGYGSDDSLLTVEKRYTDWLNAIQFVIVPERSSKFQADPWMYFKDDPEPIRMRLTDPRGRQTGIDPETGDNVQEDDSAFYSELTSFVDPLLLIPGSEPYRFLAVRNPEPGGYGVEVFGIGDGPFTLTLGTVDLDQMEDAATVTGDIVEGQTIRYEIIRQPNGNVSIDEVAAFAPRARAGNDASVFLGGEVNFDGRGSYQISGEITDHTWDFGDGASQSGAQQAHTYTVPGIYAATLTVANVDGLIATDERTITVIDPASLPEMETIRVNLTSAGDETGGAGNGKVTADGRFVVFESPAADIVPGDGNGASDVFVKDLSTGAIERVSVASNGDEGVGYSVYPSISNDGRFVAFRSAATNFVSGDDGQTDDSFLHDRTLGTTELVELGPSTGFPRVSADGERVVVVSVDALVAEDTNAVADYYVRDRETGAVELVSANASGAAVGGLVSSGTFSVSADGRVVAFMTQAAIDPSDVNGLPDIYVRDIIADTIELASLSDTGAGLTAVINYATQISQDGRYVTFETNESIVAGDNNGFSDVFVRDRELGTTERVSVSSTNEEANFISRGAGISPDGRYVAFSSRADNLAPSGSPTWQVYLRDRQEQTTVRVSVDNDYVESAPETGPPSTGGEPSVALNGAVVFDAIATNLVPDDTNGAGDVFMRRLVPSRGAATTPIANLGGPYLGWAGSDAVPATIRFDASGSLDPLNRELTAHWDFGDSSTVVDGALALGHVYGAPGIYTVSVTVSAGKDTSAPISTEVEVMPALVPDALSSDYCAAPGEEVVISGAAISVNASLIAEGWDTSTGKLPLSPAVITLPWGNVSAEPRLPGLDFRKKVELPADTDGTQQASSGALSAAFEVPCPQRDQALPQANAGGPIYEAQAGAPVVLDGSDSSDDEGAELTYFWDFGDDTSGEGATPSHTYATAGLYMVTLIVNDGLESSAPVVGTHSFAMVTVTEAADVPPEDDGCGCDCMTSSGRPTHGWLLAGAGVLALLRRRRRPGQPLRSSQ